MTIRSVCSLLLLLVLPGSAWAAYECFDIPNSASASFAAQARVFSQDVRILANAQRGNGVVWTPGACLVSQRAAGANMSVDVAACTIGFEGATASVSSGNVVVSAADATNPRIDIVWANNVGTKGITAGTPASSPLPPTMPQTGGADNVALAFVYVPATDTAITNSQITDKRACVKTPGAGSGSVTSVATTSPITGGTITTAGTIACATCVTAASALTSGRLMAGAGSQASAVTNLTGDVTTAGGVATTLVNIPTGTAMAGSVLATAIAAPGTPAAGKGSVYVDSTSKNIAVKDDAGVVKHGVQTLTCGGSDFVKSISDAGAVGCGTPAGSGTVTTTGSPANGNLTKFTGATSISNADLTGDVTTSGTVATTIANDAVTYAKMQNVSAASKLLGRGDSGAGDPQEITLGTGLTMSGTTLSSSGGGGVGVDIQQFTTSGTWTKPSGGQTVCKVWGCGGGGGGGGGQGAAVSVARTGGGGGGGGFCREYFLRISGLSATETVTVPAATAGAAGGTGAAGSDAAAGGTVTLGTRFTWPGGGGGAGNNAGSAGGGGGGCTGVGTNATTATGVIGGPCFIASAGGDTASAVGAGSTTSTSSGTAGNGSGGGGGGAGAGSATAGAALSSAGGGDASSGGGGGGAGGGVNNANPGTAQPGSAGGQSGGVSNGGGGAAGTVAACASGGDGTAGANSLGGVGGFGGGGGASSNSTTGCVGGAGGDGGGGGGGGGGGTNVGGAGGPGGPGIIIVTCM